MPAKKNPDAVRITKSATLLPATVEDLEILTVLGAHRSVSAAMASIIESYLEANPVDDLTRARYRRAKASKGRVTPMDLIVPAANVDQPAAVIAMPAREESSPQAMKVCEDCGNLSSSNPCSACGSSRLSGARHALLRNLAA